MFNHWVTTGLGGGSKSWNVLFAVLQIFRVFSCSQVMVYIEPFCSKIHMSDFVLFRISYSVGVPCFSSVVVIASLGHILSHLRSILDIPAFNNSSNCFFFFQCFYSYESSSHIPVELRPFIRISKSYGSHPADCCFFCRSLL